MSATRLLENVFKGNGRAWKRWLQAASISLRLGKFQLFARLELVAAIRSARAAQNLSLEDVAKRTGIDIAALNQIENGFPDDAAVSTLEKIADCMGKQLRFVLEDYC